MPPIVSLRNGLPPRHSINATLGALPASDRLDVVVASSHAVLQLELWTFSRARSAASNRARFSAAARILRHATSGACGAARYCAPGSGWVGAGGRGCACLLYTSDAADERSSV